MLLRLPEGEKEGRAHLGEEVKNWLQMCYNLEMPVTTRAGLGPPGGLGAACGASIQSQGSRVERLHGLLRARQHVLFRVCSFCKTASLAPSKMEKVWVRM